MAGHEFQRQQILSEELRGALGAILVIDSVKSITTNPQGEPFIRAGIDSRGIRQSAVKASVEHSHLENVTHALLDDLDAFQLGAIMERRKRRQARDCSFYLRCDASRLFEMLAAMYNPVAYDVDF